MATTTNSELRCWRCTKLVADKAKPGDEKKCLGCGARNRMPTTEQAERIFPVRERTRPSVIDALLES